MRSPVLGRTFFVPGEAWGCSKKGPLSPARTLTSICRGESLNWCRDGRLSRQGGGPMAQYRCYLLDGSGRIVTFEDVELDNIGSALDFARRLVTENQSHAFELWQGRECLHKETRVFG